MSPEPPHYWYSQEDRDLLGIPEDHPGVGHDPRPPSGAMAPFLGRRYAPEEVARSLRSKTDPHEEPHGGKVGWVRAFDVPPLLGATLHAGGEEDLGDGLRRLLAERLPGIAWETLPVGLGTLRKYLMLHQRVPAPPDEATGQPMGLELYGILIAVGGVRTGTPEAEVWYRDRTERQDRPSCQEEYGGLLPLEGALEIEIRAATYANIDNPGIGVPFYM